MRRTLPQTPAECQRERRTHCDWCGRELAPLKLRPEAECCSAKCRKARHRFGASCVPQHRASSPLRLAYFDPPYPGKAGIYRAHPDYAGEVDHRALVVEARTFDGWALSTSAQALPAVLRICAELGAVVEVAAWFRGARPHAGAKRPRVAWEPVIYAGGRAHPGAPPDALIAGVAPRTSDPRRVVGAKPAAFAFWIFELLGARPGDSFEDRYPGSGGIARAWRMFERADASALEPSRPAAARVPADVATRPALRMDACAGEPSRRARARVPLAGGTRREDLRPSLRTSRRVPRPTDTRPASDASGLEVAR